MAEEIIDTGITIPEEMRENIENVGADLDKAERALSALKEMGLNVTELEEKLAWSRNIRDVMLKNFT